MDKLSRPILPGSPVAIVAGRCMGLAADHELYRQSRWQHFGPLGWRGPPDHPAQADTLNGVKAYLPCSRIQRFVAARRYLMSVRADSLTSTSGASHANITPLDVAVISS